MMVKKATGSICQKCGAFSKKFVICEHCHRKLCLKCVQSDTTCFECYMLRSENKIVQEYFEDKYAKHNILENPYVT